jgi:hypothetical protein
MEEHDVGVSIENPDSFIGRQERSFQEPFEFKPRPPTNN